jgi:hypothetical protein
MLNSTKFRRPHAAALLLAAAGVAVLAVPAVSVAHHAFAAEYDGDRGLQLEGTVQKVRWVNPHSWLFLDVAGPGGQVTTWQLEFGTPNALANAGLGREDLKPGQHVSIKGYRSKTPGPYGYSAVLTLPDGRSIKTGGAGDAPGTANGSGRPAGTP